MKKTILTTMVGMAISTGAVQASTDISGYGTFGFNQTMESGDTHNGINSHGSWDDRTKFGLQVDTGILGNLKGSAQVKLAEDVKNPNQFKLTVEKAFLGYDFNDHFMVRAGRLGAPFYLKSEYLDVGQVNTVATHEISVYGQAPFQNYNGVDLIYTMDLNDDAQIQIQPYAGSEDFEDKNGTYRANYLAGVNLNYMTDSLKARIGYTVGEMDDPNDIMPNSDLWLDDDMGSFLTLGMEYEGDNYTLTSEYAVREVSDAKLLGKLEGLYVTGAYHIGDWSPYLTVQGQRTGSDTKALGVNYDFNSYGIGTKVSLQDNVSLKAEWIRYDYQKNGSFGYANVYNGNTANKSSDVMTVTLETLF